MLVAKTCFGLVVSVSSDREDACKDQTITRERDGETFLRWQRLADPTPNPVLSINFAKLCRLIHRTSISSQNVARLCVTAKRRDIRTAKEKTRKQGTWYNTECTTTQNEHTLQLTSLTNRQLKARHKSPTHILRGKHMVRQQTAQPFQLDLASDGWCVSSLWEKRECQCFSSSKVTPSTGPKFLKKVRSSNGVVQQSQ